jgi:hypothetical protein
MPSYCFKGRGVTGAEPLSPYKDFKDFDFDFDFDFYPLPFSNPSIIGIQCSFNSL